MVAGKYHSFVDPVKSSVQNLLGKLPNAKAFAGSEDLADDQGGVAPSKLGLVGRLKNFKKSLHEMGDFQKLVLLTIAVVLPAGILISTVLVGIIKKRKGK